MNYDNQTLPSGLHIPPMTDPVWKYHKIGNCYVKCFVGPTYIVDMSDECYNINCDKNKENGV